MNAPDVKGLLPYSPPSISSPSPLTSPASNKWISGSLAEAVRGVRPVGQRGLPVRLIVNKKLGKKIFSFMKRL